MGGNSAATDQQLYVWLIGLGVIFLFYRLVRPALDSQRWGVALDFRPGTAPLLIFSVLFLALFLPPVFIPIALLAIGVHEYGHVLAMRLAGHKNPRFQFTPFGGIAYSAPVDGARKGELRMKERSHLEAFFISIMGPGFSLALMVLFLLLGEALSVLESSTVVTDPETGALRAHSAFFAAIAYQAAFWIGFLNALNLLPIYPFDGGRALQSILSAFGPHAMRRGMQVLGIGVTALAALLALIFKMWVLLLFCVLGLLMSGAMLRAAERILPMRPGEALLAALCYLTTLAALGYLSSGLFFQQISLALAIAQARFGF